nr:hypothetical protein [Tanacetum cinerariifolium]
SSGLRRFFRYAMFIIYSTYVMYCHYIRSLSVMLSRISFHVLYGSPRVGAFLLGCDGVSSGSGGVEGRVGERTE